MSWGKLCRAAHTLRSRGCSVERHSLCERAAVLVSEHDWCSPCGTRAGPVDTSGAQRARTRAGILLALFGAVFGTPSFFAHQHVFCKACSDFASRSNRRIALGTLLCPRPLSFLYTELQERTRDEVHLQKQARDHHRGFRRYRSGARRLLRGRGRSGVPCFSQSGEARQSTIRATGEPRVMKASIRPLIPC
jgi:hypothetical protein